jgi:Domain of unknown function (DUF1918)
MSHRTVTPGDRLVVESHHVGEHERVAEVVEVIAGPGSPRYRVRWDDGHETVIVPGPDVVITHAARR